MEKILVIDNSKSIRDSLENFLSRLHYHVVLADDGISGLNLFYKEKPHLVLCAYQTNGLKGFEILKKIREFNPHIPVIILSCCDDIQIPIIAMQNGAYDILDKPINITILKKVIERALYSYKISEDLSVSPDEEGEINRNNHLIGKNPKMIDVLKIIGQVSSNRVTVLIQGESGVGKELVSRMIHNSGITRNQPFIAFNCSALTETLLESELFGHERGAFTGAIKNKRGKFELAGEGTIFLDEISEISHDIQIKLLRILEEKEFERVGAENSIPQKARIIAATNKNLTDLVENGKFRADLYYRLKVVTVNIPALRERREDIPHLVVYLLKKINAELHKNVNKIPFEVMEMLQNYDWIGNVRELENTLLQAVVLSQSDVLEKENILLRKGPAIFEINKGKNLCALSEIEKKYIKYILDELSWNKSESCKILGISKPTLYNKISRYSLSPDS